MKIVFLIFFILPLPVLAQQNSTDSLGYLFRTFDTTPCSGCPMLKPGDQFPYSHPNADRLNDTTLWHWVEGPFPDTKMYDLKPQYKDTIIRNDGSVIEVPIWLKNPYWVKPISDGD